MHITLKPESGQQEHHKFGDSLPYKAISCSQKSQSPGGSGRGRKKKERGNPPPPPSLWASLPGYLGFLCFFLSFLYSYLSHYCKPLVFLFGENMPVLCCFLHTLQLDRQVGNKGQSITVQKPRRCQERWHYSNPGLQHLHKAVQCASV